MYDVAMQNDVYDAPTKVQVAFATVVTDIYEKIGSPQDISNRSGELFVKELFKAWKTYFFDEYDDFIEAQKLRKNSELSLSQLLKGGGYIPTSLPPRFHQMMKVFMPDFKINDMDNMRKLASILPELQSSNLSI